MPATSAPRGRSPSHLSAPVLKMWGKQRPLRFSGPRVDGDATAGEGHAPADTQERRPHTQERRPPSLPAERAEAGESDDDDYGLEQMREKLLGYLREAAERMKLIGVPRPAEKAPPPVPVAKPPPAVSARPSKPSARRAARKSSVETPSRSLPPPPPERSIRLRSDDRGRKEERRPRFSLSLTREEIEEDIFAMSGSRPRRRPKKHPRDVQRRLDSLSPGLLLTEISAESYKVAD